MQATLSLSGLCSLYSQRLRESKGGGKWEREKERKTEAVDEKKDRSGAIMFLITVV